MRGATKWKNGKQLFSYAPRKQKIYAGGRRSHAATMWVVGTRRVCGPLYTNSHWPLVDIAHKVCPGGHGGTRIYIYIYIYGVEGMYISTGEDIHTYVYMHIWGDV